MCPTLDRSQRHRDPRPTTRVLSEHVARRPRRRRPRAAPVKRSPARNRRMRRQNSHRTAITTERPPSIRDRRISRRVNLIHRHRLTQTATMRERRRHLPLHRNSQRQISRRPTTKQLHKNRAIRDPGRDNTPHINKMTGLDLSQHSLRKRNVVDIMRLRRRITSIIIPTVLITLQERDNHVLTPLSKRQQPTLIRNIRSRVIRPVIHQHQRQPVPRRIARRDIQQVRPDESARRHCECRQRARARGGRSTGAPSGCPRRRPPSGTRRDSEAHPHGSTGRNEYADHQTEQ